jgi:hypothetical protein
VGRRGDHVVPDLRPHRTVDARGGYRKPLNAGQCARVQRVHLDPILAVAERPRIVWRPSGSVNAASHDIRRDARTRRPW